MKYTKPDPLEIRKLIIRIKKKMKKLVINYMI